MMKFRLIALVGLLAACAPTAPDEPTDVPVPPMVPEAADTASTPDTAPFTEITVDGVSEGDHVTSPLIVTGVAPNNWYFEAVFPVQLVSAEGTVLAEAPAQAQTSWMEEGPVPFEAELVFDIDAMADATLVFQEDMPEEGVDPREVRIAVMLMPTTE